MSYLFLFKLEIVIFYNNLWQSNKKSLYINYNNVSNNKPTHNRSNKNNL